MSNLSGQARHFPGIGTDAQRYRVISVIHDQFGHDARVPARNGTGDWALRPFFISNVTFRIPLNQTFSSSLQSALADLITGLDYEFVGLELLNQGYRNQLLRVYIDHPEGITLDDCARVSHQVSGFLDVEDPLPDAYRLEISSPGLDRPLFSLEHFSRFAGREVNLKLQEKISGRRRFQAVIAGVTGDQVCLTLDAEELIIPFDQIKSARLVPEL